VNVIRFLMTLGQGHSESKRLGPGLCSIKRLLILLILSLSYPIIPRNFI